jgi:hypothetical protein
MRASAVSGDAQPRDVETRTGQGTEFRSVGGFFLLMGVGDVLEHGFKEVTGRTSRVGELTRR